MKTVQLEVKKCPACGQLMLPTADQTGWFCPYCPDPAPAAPGREEAEPGRFEVSGAVAPRPEGRSEAAPRIASPASRAATGAGAGGMRSSPSPRLEPREPRSVAPEESVPASQPFFPVGIDPLDEREFAASDLVGKLLGGRYRLESVLGQGAMGAVYRAVQVALNKPYAIKVLLPSLTHDRQFEARFRQEAQIAASLRHPGLVEVFDYGVEDGLAYYVMEFLEGRTLSEALRDRVALDPEEAVGIVAAAADAVGVAHDRGVVHRDLKPANLFLARDSTGRERVKVLDFGLSKAVASVLADKPPMTVNGAICGTPAYMSPEQAKGKSVDGRSDIYSLAVVLFRILTGKVPFDAAESLVVLYMHIDHQPPALEKCRPGIYVPAALEAALYRALAKRPEDRFRSMVEFAAALRSSVADRPSGLSDPAMELPAVAPPRESSPLPFGPASAQPSRGRAAPLPHEPASSSGGRAVPSRPPPPRAHAPGGGIAPLAPESMVLAPGAATAAEARELQPAASAGLPRSPRERTLFLAAGGAIGAIALVAIGLIFADPWRVVPENGGGGVSPPSIRPETTPAPTPSPTPPDFVDQPPIEDGPMTPSKYGSTTGTPPPSSPTPTPKPAPTARPAPVPRPPVAPIATPKKARLVLTSKVAARVVATAGAQRVELSTHSPHLFEVPAGKLSVSFALLDAPGRCTVVLEIPEAQQRSLVFGPEVESVAQLGGPEGRRKLECR